MNQSANLIFCLILLTLSGTQGVPLSRTVRCTCITIDNRPFNPKALEKLEIIPASQSCPHVEIIAQMKKNKEKRCLNPESEAIKSLLKAVSKKGLRELLKTREKQITAVLRRMAAPHPSLPHTVCQILLSVDCSSPEKWPARVTTLAAMPGGWWMVHPEITATPVTELLTLLRRASPRTSSDSW